MDVTEITTGMYAKGTELVLYECVGFGMTKPPMKPAFADGTVVTMMDTRYIDLDSPGVVLVTNRDAPESARVTVHVLDIKHTVCRT